MPFYIRKAFRSGPVRFNLSQHGLGLSLGVTGARIGLMPGGQVYTHAGRHGLYHKQVLGRVGDGNRARRRPEKQVHRVDTGQTFAARPDYVPQMEVDLPGAGPVSGTTTPRAIAGGVGVVVAGALALASGPPAVTVAVAGVGAVLLGSAVGTGRRDARVRRFVEALADATLPDDPATADARRDRVRALRATIDDERAHDAAARVYVSAAIAVTADEIVDPTEAEGLAWLAANFGLDEEFVRDARADAVRAALLGMVADRELDRDEEQRFDALCRELGVDPGELDAERDTVAHLRRIRAATEGTLEPVEASVDLKRGETCWFEAPGRVLSEKNLESRQRQGVRHVVRGFVTRHEGTLVVTDRRIALLHRGTTAVDLRRITDVEFDLDASLITVSKRGVARPTWFTCERAREAAAILAHRLEAG